MTGTSWSAIISGICAWMRKNVSTCVLIGLDVKGDFLEMAKLRVLLNKARKKRELHVVLLAETQEQQKEVNRYLGTEGLCFHKESDFVKIAHYLVERYGANPKNREKRSPGSA